MPKFQIRDNTAGLAFYEGATAEEALAVFLRDTLHALTMLDLIEPGAEARKGAPDAVLHTENGRPAELTFDGERFYAVPA